MTIFARASSRLTFSLLACSPLGLRAQSSTTPPAQLAPVVVQGRDSDLLGLAISASQGIVGTPQLDARPFLRRGELLEVIPGVVITQHSGNGKANQYFLRGFNLDHGTDFSISVDAMPVNLRSHAHGQGYADLNFLIPEMVRQVDYTKGPFDAEVGDFSAAGAAHFRQADRLSRPFVAIGVGENRFARFVAGGSLAQGPDALTGAIEVSHDDGPWQLGENAKRLSGFTRQTWSRPEANLRLTAMAYHGTWRSSDQIPLRAVESGVLDRLGHVDPSDGGSSTRASVSFDADLQGTSGTTRASAYAIFYELNLFSNFTYFLDDPVNGDQFNQRDRRCILGGALQRGWSHVIAGAASNTTLGVQARADFISELGLHRTRQRVPLSTVRDDEVDETSVGVFAGNETRWNDWLRTNAGLRLDAFHFDVKSDEQCNSGARLADIVSPKLSVALGPWARTEVYVNAGFGFHSNDARGTTIHIDPADRISLADSVTPLARSRGAELGVRIAPVSGLVTTLSAWALDLDSELVFVGDAGSTEPTGRSRRYGIELANFYRIRPWLAVDADLALTRARYRDDIFGARIANSISSVVTAGVTLGRHEGWFGSMRLRYFGDQPLTEDNSVRAPSSLTLNAAFGWRAGHWQAAVETLNLADRKNYDIAYHYTSRLVGEPAEGVDDVHFHPAEPRTVRIAVTRRF